MTSDGTYNAEEKLAGLEDYSIEFDASVLHHMVMRVPVQMLYMRECLLLVAPMHDEKLGWGYASIEISREVLEDQFKPILQLIDDAVVCLKRKENVADD